MLPQILRRFLLAQPLQRAVQPGLLLAAGPGLDQVLPHLERLARHMVVVAVDTAISIATANGVDPHL